MFKLEHSEALVLLTIIEATQFGGKDVPMLAKLIAKIQREAEKTAPRPEVDVTTDGGWVDGSQ